MLDSNNYFYIKKVLGKVSNLHFCTLFDSGFLARGLSLYESLLKNCDNFQLYIFAFDSHVGKVLRSYNLKFVTVIEPEDFEDAALLSVKSSRSRGEYCWTCTPHVIRYCLDKYGLDHCIYLDADLFFFSSPRPALERFLDSSYSVFITPHNYTGMYDQSHTSGIYCVQFMPFKNDHNGRSVLEWWGSKCLEWCFARAENGKFGDQKYLDNWPEQFSGVYVETSVSFALGPWNIQNAELIERGDRLYLVEDHSAKAVVFYHFHALKLHWNHSPSFGSYYLAFDVIEKIYRRYLNQFLEIGKKYSLQDTPIDPYGRTNFNNLLEPVKGPLRLLREAFKLAIDKK